MRGRGEKEDQKCGGEVSITALDVRKSGIGPMLFELLVAVPRKPGGK